MIYCRQAHTKVVASQSNANPDKKNKQKIFLQKIFYISTLISYNIATLVNHNKTVT